MKVAGRARSAAERDDNKPKKKRRMVQRLRLQKRNTTHERGGVY